MKWFKLNHAAHPVASVAVASLCLLTAGAPVEAQVDEEFVVIHAGRVITVSGDEIEDGTIVIVDGKIRLVGKGVDYPADAEVIDARDQVVMPGMIHVDTRANLPSFSRNGNHSHRSVMDEVRYDELELEPYVRNGFTAVCLSASGRGIPGMSAVYRTAGPAPIDEFDDDARILNEAAYLPVAFTNPGSDKRALHGAFTKAQSEIDKVEKARKEWEEKQKQEAEAKKKAEEQQKQKEENDKQEPAPQQSNGEDSGGEGNGADGEAQEEPKEFKPPAIDPASKRFVELIQEDADFPLVLQVSGASDFLHAEHVMSEYEQVPYRYLFGGGFRSDYNYIVEEAAASDVLIALPPSFANLPDTVTRFNLAGELARASASFAFFPASGSEQSMSEMRGAAGDLVRGGLDRDAAIRALTINQAEFVGVADRLGTIEKDKDADLIFLDGDPLDPHTTVVRVMILGESVWTAEEGDDE